jgi:hypothetical protein
MDAGGIAYVAAPGRRVTGGIARSLPPLVPARLDDGASVDDPPALEAF